MKSFNRQQRPRITGELLKLKADITAADRSACAKKLKISKVTISYYLNGQVTNSDLALEMIKLFKERIADREIKLNSLCQTNSK